ncbi:MAG: fused MFS/spermidine synthase [bacterium]|nr:fused MFS/spermidine synthase [bacterium]
MKKKLLLLSFIEGAAVMAAELCGAKLLAPIFGSSLVVWASVMGITLAALAAGYFFGGRISHQTKNHRQTLFRILAGAALFITLMPVLSYYLVPRISYLPFLSGVVLSTFSILFFPIFFLGAASPLFIVLQTHKETEAGRVSGTVYAVSTAGGILATFLCGFFIIPVFGLSQCLIFFGSLLLLTNFLVFRSVKVLHLFFFVLFVYLNFQFISKSSGTLFSSDSIQGHLEVQDVARGADSVRLLTINDIIQSEMNVQTHRSVSAYVRLLDSLVPNSIMTGNALVLGLGAGLTANMVVEKNYSTDGVEFDDRIIESAKHYFYLNKNVNTTHADARFFLNSCTKKYDIVLADLFKAEEQPSHVLTLESLTALKKNLQEGAIVLVSWHGYLSEEKGRGSVILVNTFVKAGYFVKLCAMSHDERFRNIVFVASLNKLPELPFELHEEMAKIDLINTDDAPRLEKYNAEANKAWRTQYLRYYQNAAVN